MRLIDADDVKKFARTLDGLSESQLIDVLYVIANEVPTADAVPVVRCRDCKYFSTDNLFGGIEATICVISVLNHPLRNADDYCSRGERKD